MRISIRALLVLVCLSLVLTLLPWGSLASIPIQSPNPDASRTITWTMTNASSLNVQGVGFGGGNASLQWAQSFVSWPNGTAIAAEGSLDSNLTASPSGISLAANWSNRLSEGNFSHEAPWTFVNGSADNTTASWDSLDKWAQINHTSGSTEFMWDTLDAYPGNWSQLAFGPGSSSALYPVSDGSQKQGNSALKDYINVSTGSAYFAGAQHIGSVDWSPFTQLRLWIYLNTSAPAAFNVSASSGLNLYSTTPVNLHPSWQEVVVDLKQFGSDRSALSAVTFRIVGQGGQHVPPVTVYFDAVRVGFAKTADTTAFVHQSFDKNQVTTPLVGSAYLSFDWCLTNDVGVDSFLATANLSGPIGDDIENLVPSDIGQWSHFRRDVSPTVTAADVYRLTFSLRVVLDNTSASNVTLLVDNASFVFPGTQNGTYLSNVQTMTYDSAYASLDWLAATPSADTSVELGLRSGNTSDPNGPSWSNWQTWSSSPAAPTAVPGAVYFQLRAYLTTTNASVSPTLESLTLTTEHRSDHGTILSGIVRADPDFLTWRSFNASFTAGPGTSVTFTVGNSSIMSPVTPGSSLHSLQGPVLQWQADLVTSDGLLTPVLHNVSVTYEYQGDPVRVAVTARGSPVAPGTILNVTSGEAVEFGAVVFDAGSHTLPPTIAPVAWSISNSTGGTVYPNGTYVAGKPGRYQISVVVLTASLFRIIEVNVSSTSHSLTTPFNLLDAWPILAVGVAAGAGFVAYEVLVRRLFAIDDVFLIAKDGRLIVHNTRRMRADRDEDILSGMLTAIMAFLRDQDPEENGELKQFQVGGKTTLLERGTHVYLSAVYSGRVPGWAGKDLHRFVSDLEAKFGDAFEEWSGSPEDLHDVKEYMRRFVSHVRYHGDRKAGSRAS